MYNMKYFAEIQNNIVQRVIVADSLEWCVSNLGGEWVETFADKPDKNYAGVGFIYYPEQNNFSSPQPFESWSLNSRLEWEAPTPMPTDAIPTLGQYYTWDENNKTWVMVNRTKE